MNRTFCGDESESVRGRVGMGGTGLKSHPHAHLCYEREFSFLLYHHLGPFLVTFRQFSIRRWLPNQVQNIFPARLNIRTPRCCSNVVVYYSPNAKYCDQRVCLSACVPGTSRTPLLLSIDGTETDGHPTVT